MYAGESKEKEFDGPREFQKEVSVAIAVALASPGALLSVDSKENEGSSNKAGGGGGKSNQLDGFSSSSGGRGSPPVEPWSSRSVNSEADEPTMEEMAQHQMKANVMSSKQLENALHTVERAVMQNMYHAKQLRYRGLPNATEITTSSSLSASDGGMNAISVNQVSHSGGISAASSINNGGGAPPGSPATPANLVLHELNSPTASQSHSLPWSEGNNNNNSNNGLASAGGVGNDQRNPSGGGDATSVNELFMAGESKSRLMPLFDFICTETKGRTVHTMSFNKSNADVLAVAYGSKIPNPRATPHSAPHSMSSNGEVGAKEDGGLVAFWSLRNPQ